MLLGGVRDGVPFVADEWNPWEDEEVEYNSALNKKRKAFKQYMAQIDRSKPKRYKVQIWGKAAIGRSPYSINDPFIEKLPTEKEWLQCHRLQLHR